MLSAVVLAVWCWLAALAGCGGGQVFIVEGTVVEVHPPTEVVIDHAAIPGLMGAMVMPFEVADPTLLSALEPGSKVVARYRVSEQGSAIVALRITGHGPAPTVATGPAPLRIGERLPRAFTLTAHDGSTVVVGPHPGDADGDRVALTFVYTRCPRPEFCPATVAKLQAIRAALGDDVSAVRLVAVTLDPAYDTVDVLAAFAATAGAAAPAWVFARAEPDALADLAMYAGLPVLRPDASAGASGGASAEPAEIAHGLRVAILDRDGALIERYDDLGFDVARVVTQLRTGAPTGDPGNSGTISAPPDSTQGR